MLLILGWGGKVGNNIANDVNPCMVPCTQIKKVGNEGFSRGIPENKLKVIPYWNNRF